MACNFQSAMLALCLLLAVSGTLAQEEEGNTPDHLAAPSPSLGGPPGENEAGVSAPVPSQMAPSTERQHVDLSTHPFHSIQLCWPFNTLVQTGSGYFLDFQAEDVVLDGLGFNVEDDTLTLFTTASMESAFPVILVVTMPTGVLTSLYLSSPIAEVTLGPGLQVPQFTAAAPFAGGNIVLIDIIVDTLNMQTTGLGTVVANGTITNATITASGVSNVYLIGLANYATVNLAGTANVYVKPSSDNAAIVGQASGVNSVMFDQGRCLVNSPWMFGAPCKQTDDLGIPEPDPNWTCGLEVTGNFNCPAGGTAAASKASLSGVLPLLSIPVVPPNSPQERVVAGFPAIVNPAPIEPTQALSSPAPRPAFVANPGQSLPYANPAGQGTQAAQSSSNPSLQSQNIGANAFGAGNSGGLPAENFAALGGRRLKQAFTSGNPTGASTSIPFEGALTAMDQTATFIQSYPCYYDNIGGWNALEIYPDVPFTGTLGKK